MNIRGIAVRRIGAEASLMEQHSGKIYFPNTVRTFLQLQQ